MPTLCCSDGLTEKRRNKRVSATLFRNDSASEALNSVGFDALIVTFIAAKQDGTPDR